MSEKIMFKRIGTMIDCSRNAVMNIESLKKWINLTSDMGYNTLMLYMEDTYEVNDNPYFGYGRGRYSKQELKEIDEYALSLGVEVIPCIQTLAHLNALVDNAAYKEIVDCNDILLVGDERVYKLIDNMFASLSECLSTKHINVGMDEAHMIGRGKYYDLHGDCDRTEMLVGHVKRVAEIAKKYGYSISMWSDMFFRIASGGDYYNTKFEVSDEIRNMIPENVELAYWDYYSKDKKHYDDMFKAHRKIKEGTWFAGGFWAWSGFSPCNKFSIDASRAALRSCEEQGVENIFFTIWGDDTAECAKFSTLPSLFYVSEFIKGNRSLKSIKEKFKSKFGISFDRFMLLDLRSKGRLINPHKYIFFNDLFSSRMDSLIVDEASEEYAVIARKLNLLKKDENWGYLFDTLSKLCKVDAIKADIGKRIREAYKNGDKAALRIIIKDCKRLKKLTESFYEAFRTQWMLENKGYGFDIQNIRIGGTISRIEHCTRMLEDFVNGRITKIDELEEEILDFKGCGKEYIKEDARINSFRRIVSANILSW